MRHSRKLLVLSLGALLTGCGGPSPEPSAVPETVAEPSVERGIILGTRPLGSVPVAEARLRLVSQVVGAAQGTGVPAGSNIVELIIRLERGGRDVALVQPGEAWLQPGQRVRLTPCARPVVTRELSGA